MWGPCIWDYFSWVWISGHLLNPGHEKGLVSSWWSHSSLPSCNFQRTFFLPHGTHHHTRMSFHFEMWAMKHDDGLYPVSSFWVTEFRETTWDDNEPNWAVSICDLQGAPSSASLISTWCDRGPLRAALMAVGGCVCNCNSSGYMRFLDMAAGEGSHFSLIKKAIRVV